jgi:hypothetical protein
MSYIDTFDHELVGFFAGLPLYHPLEAVAGSGGEQFGCTPRQLVLGGGSGEHPAVVLRQPPAAVVAFLQAALPADAPALAPESQQLLDDIPPFDECLHFAGWSIAYFMAFHKRCRAPSFVTPYDAEQVGALEAWVLRNLGEFVYFAMPEVAPDVPTQLADVCAQVRRPRYFNLQILPPGFAAPAGRRRTASGDGLWVPTPGRLNANLPREAG